jgi:type IV pilus assembly protein PilF
MKLSKILTLVLLVLMSVGCASQESQEKYNENLKARARSHTDLGAVYFQQKQYEIALEEFNTAIKINPNYALAYNGLGLVNADLGKSKEADGYFKKAIELEPDNSESRNNYGTFLCGKSRYDESIVQFMAAIKNPLYATPAVAYTNAGICSIGKNDFTNAEGYFQKALQLDPLSGNAAFHLASSQFNRKDYIGAKKTLQNVLIAQPGPELLWLAIRVARALDDKDEEASYALQLRRLFPGSEQAKLLQNGK